MNTSGRLAAFGVGLVAVLGVGAGIGAAVGPDASSPTSTDVSATGSTTMDPAMDMGPRAPVGEGIVTAKDGYRLVAAATTLDPAGGTFRFVITAPDGSPQLAFTPVDEESLHLTVVNRELTSFHHLHPTRSAVGTWSIDLPALEAGSYRSVADFRITGGPRLALGADLAVAGTYRPVQLPEPSARTTVDGYDVDLTTQATVGGKVTATLSVNQGGQPVTDLQPYQGAKGHLVAMRAGDLAYALGDPVASSPALGTGMVRFNAVLASAGRYALFFDFKHAGTVRTAAFTFDQGVVTGAPGKEH